MRNRRYTAASTMAEARLQTSWIWLLSGGALVGLGCVSTRDLGDVEVPEAGGGRDSGVVDDASHDVPATLDASAAEAPGEFSVSATHTVDGEAVAFTLGDAQSSKLSCWRGPGNTLTIEGKNADWEVAFFFTVDPMLEFPSSLKTNSFPSSITGVSFITNWQSGYPGQANIYQQTQPSFKVDLSSYSPTRISATFTGDIYNESGQNALHVTRGSFDLPIGTSEPDAGQ